MRKIGLITGKNAPPPPAGKRQSSKLFRMGKNISSTVMAFRVPHEICAALLRMAEDRDETPNAMVVRMLTRRVNEVRQEEGW